MSFIASLSYEQLQRLRAIVRKVHMAHMPDRQATLEEIDKLIVSVGEETARKMLEASIRMKAEGQEVTSFNHG